MRNFFSVPIKIPKIKQQISFIFFLSSVIPICIFGFFAISSARTEMLQQYETQIETDAIRVNSTLFDITTSIRTSTAAISNSLDYHNLFNSHYSSAKQSMLQYLNASLKNYRNNTAAISSIHVYTNNPTITTGEYVHYCPGGFAKEAWYKALGKNDYDTWFCHPYIDRFHNTLYELTLIEKIPLGDAPYSAFLVTRLDSNYIRNRLLINNHLIQSSIDDGRVFFSSNRSLIWTQMPFASSFQNQTYHYLGPVTINGTSLLTSIISFEPYKADNHFYIAVSDLNAYKNINHITLVYFIILLFATIVPGLLILLFSSYFSNRIDILRKAMHQASLGDYNIMEQFHGDDELTDTFRDLKTTVELVHQKEARYFEAQLARQQLVNTQQQMEFKMLASQINPHFLYNTLETIRMQAIACNNRDVADSISLLGKSMHYVLENTGTDSTTLQKELTHVITYLKIQRLRFGDRVNYSIYVPPYLQTEQFRILPLILQPIVENAIVHGLEGVTQHGLIELNVILEEPNLYITIHDNGDGISPEDLLQLQKSIHEKSTDTSSSIGLRNINHRLTLLYGASYGITIESTLKEGTTLTLTLPLEQLISKMDLADTLLRREQYLDEDPDDDGGDFDYETFTD